MPVPTKQGAADRTGDGGGQNVARIGNRGTGGSWRAVKRQPRPSTGARAFGAQCGSYADDRDCLCKESHQGGGHLAGAAGAENNSRKPAGAPFSSPRPATSSAKVGRKLINRNLDQARLMSAMPLIAARKRT